MKTMPTKTTFNSVLVPTDFSENAWRAFEHAITLVSGEDSTVVVVHVIDQAFVDQIVEMGVGEHKQVLESLRASASEKLKRYGDASTDSLNVDTIVCTGQPFFEIIQKADDFAVDAVVMSKLGQRSEADSLLFGSTAEKVTRGIKKPVVILPSEG